VAEWFKAPVLKFGNSHPIPFCSVSPRLKYQGNFAVDVPTAPASATDLGSKMVASLRRAIGTLDQPAQRQLRHIGNIGVVEMTAAALCEHGGNALQIQITFLDRQGASRVNDGGKLAIG
jgi:hypothetical protein